MMQFTILRLGMVIIAALFVGACAYRLRCQNRFWYGIFEIVVGVGVVILTVFPFGPELLTTDYVNPNAAFGAVIGGITGPLAGVYVIVRGLDNVETKLPNSWRAIWQRAFGDAR